jgi:hypothetical protein
MSDILNLIISDLGGHALNCASYHILHSRHAGTVRMTIGELVMNSSDIQHSPARTAPLATISIGVLASYAGATLLFWLLLRLL